MARGNFCAPAQQGNISIFQGSSGAQEYVGRQDNRILADFSPMGAQWDWDTSDFWQNRGGLRVDGVTIFTVTIDAATIAYSPQTVGVNAQTSKAVTAGAITYSPQTVTQKNAISYPVTAATIIFSGQPVTVNARANKVITAATIAFTPQTVIVDAQVDYYATVTAATITYSGKATSVSQGRTIVAATINYQGQPITVFNSAFASDSLLSRVSITIGIRTG